MAAPDGPAPELVALLDALAEAPYRYDFFAAVRAIEAAGGATPLGAAARPAQEPVRLGQRASMRFAPAALCALEQAGGRTWVMGEFFGLFGPNGPLPIHLTEHALSRRINADDPTFQRFADLFHHRLLALLYRAWASARPAVGFHHGEGAAFRRQLDALTGASRHGSAAAGEDAACDADARRYFAAAFAPGPRSAEGLARMVGACFRVDAQVVEFVAQWLELPAESRCRLGRAPSATVGGSAVLGARVWTAQTRFRLVVGPVGLYRFLALLPGQPALARLASMVEQYAGPELTWELVLRLRRDEAPAMMLGQQGRLGWTSWLGRVPERQSTCDVVLSGERSSAHRAASLAAQPV